MNQKEVNGFLWRCINCEWMMGHSTDLKHIPKEWTCPKCGKINKFHFGKIVFKLNKSKSEKKSEKIYSDLPYTK